MQIIQLFASITKLCSCLLNVSREIYDTVETSSHYSSRAQRIFIKQVGWGPHETFFKQDPKGP